MLSTSSESSRRVSEARGTAMPSIVTHRFHPVLGAYRNLCTLGQSEAEEVVHCLLRVFGRVLKANYLARRWSTEEWLPASAQDLLQRPLSRYPVYFFMGDFSRGLDRSRPASLQIPLASLPPHRITFTLMRVATQPDRRLYSLHQLKGLFARGLVSELGLADRTGFQKTFSEVQVWAFPQTPPRAGQPGFLEGTLLDVLSSAL
jgi:hypothetical protein